MNPGYVPALLEYARFQIEKGDISMAEHYFKHTLKKDPSNAEALLAYAQFTREHKKNKKEALQLYRQACFFIFLFIYFAVPSFLYRQVCFFVYLFILTHSLTMILSLCLFFFYCCTVRLPHGLTMILRYTRSWRNF